MRFLFIACFFLISSACLAQNYDRISFSKFDKPTDIALLDTLKKALASGEYGKYISDQHDVFIKGSSRMDFSAVNSILNRLSRNGTDDVSKCFYPRHSINFYKGTAIVKYILICFECEGVRFSDERWMTDVKDENKRIKLMNELKEEFKKKGFVN